MTALISDEYSPMMAMVFPQPSLQQHLEYCENLRLIE